jgi:hypothetical protein
MDMGHFNMDDVDTAKQAASGGLVAKWLICEKRISKALDEIADNMGFRPAPWYKWYTIGLVLWFLLIILCLLRRPDFFDLSFCSICIYAFIMSHQVNRKAL